MNANGPASVTFTIAGGLVIEDLRIEDELFAAVRSLCFEAVEVLATPGTSYTYRYLRSAAHLTLEASRDGTLLSITGDEIDSITLSRPELLVALYACGLRYIGMLEAGRADGQPVSAELSQLRPYLQRARAALTAPDPVCGARPVGQLPDRS
ncbi:hypothetical protein [Kribbella catacumbae]|uniref:hypothetical protein n=1 Tax=Kribbella catacumbae TaxID=460086 RepID=UPI00036C9FBE|nr:hypothetical protein [Kribbella catacumbae]